MSPSPGPSGFASRWGVSASGDVPGPVPRCYWVIEGRFAAGAHPSASSPSLLSALVGAGFDRFIDLTEGPGYAVPTPDLLVARHPIPDFTAPTVGTALAILDGIDQMLDEGHTVYLHCWAGIGRTGTIVGCWLRRHGEAADTALETLGRLRRGDADRASLASPETGSQRRLVTTWAE